MCPLGPLDKKHDRIVLFSLLLGLFSIISAHLFEHIGGYKPCPLCLEQREPYYFALPLLVLILGFTKLFQSRVCFLRGLMLIAGLVMLFGAILGIYHAGAEWQFWQGPRSCGTQNNLYSDTTDLLSALKSAKIISCTKVQWRFLYLSFAGWNALISLIIALSLIITAFMPNNQQLK